MADSCECGHPWAKHDRDQGCWHGWVTHSEGFLEGGCECANHAPDPGPHLDKNGAPCTCVAATGEGDDRG